MPEVVRVNRDNHYGHAGYRVPYHKSYYVTGSPTVFANNEQVVRIGDQVGCGDRANAGSPNVFANNIPVHRRLDATTGHGSWVPNYAESGSPNVIANG